jgi:hypothetical protein
LRATDKGNKAPEQILNVSDLEEIEEDINNVEDHLSGRILRTRTTKIIKKQKLIIKINNTPLF